MAEDFKADQVLSNTLKFNLYANAAARNSAFPSPTEGQIVALAEPADAADAKYIQVYQNNQWNTIGTITSGILTITGGEGEAAGIVLESDENDDAGDGWQIIGNDAGTGKLTFKSNQPDSSSPHDTYTEMVSFTAHAAALNSVAAFAGSITVAKDATITGDLTVNGTTTTVATTNTLVKDKLITINDGGATNTARGAGIEFEENNAIEGFMKTSSSGEEFEFKVPEGGHTLTLDINADKEITVAGDLNIEADSAINQDVTTDATVRFSKVEIDGSTDWIDVKSSNLTANASAGFVVDAVGDIELNAGGGDILFKKATAEYMRVKDGGNVGIGEANPDTVLHAVGNSGLTIEETAGTGRKLIIEPPTASTVSTIRTDNTGAGLLLKSYSGGSQMFLKDDGNVGFGTVTPNEKITVEGSISLDEIGSAPSATSGYGKIYVKAADSKLYYLNDSGAEIDLTAGGMTSFTVDADNGTPQTITNGNTLNINGSTGIDVAVAATDTIQIAVDYSGADSVIMAATNGTGITVDSANDKLLVYDNDATTVKYINVNQLPLGASGDITGVTLTADDSNTVSQASGHASFTIAGGSGLNTTASSSTLTVAADYSGADSIIMAATDGTGITVDGANDKLLIYDNDTTTVKYVQADKVGKSYAPGDGLDISGNTFSIDLKANAGLKIDSTELSVNYGATNNIIKDAADGTSIGTAASTDQLLIHDADANAVKFINVSQLPSSGGGSSTLVGLSDTPANFTSAANRFVKVNASANAIEFVAHTIPGAVGDLSDVPAIGGGDGNKFVKVNSSANAYEYVNVNVPANISDLGDVDTIGSNANRGKFLKVKTGSDAVEYVSHTIPGAIVDLSDVPSYGGGGADRGKILKVQNGADSIEYSQVDEAIAGLYTITANGTSDYRFAGPGLTGSENDPTLYLIRGRRYQFYNNSGGHSFQFQTNANGTVGTGGQIYTTGITFASADDIDNGETATWEVMNDAPSTLYYQCKSHTDMGGQIKIVDGTASSNSTTTGQYSIIGGSGATATLILRADDANADGQGDDAADNWAIRASDGNKLAIGSAYADSSAPFDTFDEQLIFEGGDPASNALITAKAQLRIDDDLFLDTYMKHYGNATNRFHFGTNTAHFDCNGINPIFSIDGNSAQKEVIVNDTGSDVDFRVESEGDTHLIFTSASHDRVGIGLNSPSAKLEVLETTDQLKLSYDGANAVEFNVASNGEFKTTGNSSGKMIQKWANRQQEYEHVDAGWVKIEVDAIGNTEIMRGNTGFTIERVTGSGKADFTVATYGTIGQIVPSNAAPFNSGDPEHLAVIELRIASTGTPDEYDYRTGWKHKTTGAITYTGPGSGPNYWGTSGSTGALPQMGAGTARITSTTPNIELKWATTTGHTQSDVWRIICPIAHPNLTLQSSFGNIELKSGASVMGTFSQNSWSGSANKIQGPSNAPASASAAGTQGEIRFDSNYIYMCVANNVWKRVAISTW